MLKRLVVLVSVLVVTVAGHLATARASVVSLRAAASATSIRFDSEAVDLQSVRAAHLELGAYSLTLPAGELRQQAGARAIVVVGVDARFDAARLSLRLDPHASQSTRHSRRVIHIRPVRGSTTVPSSTGISSGAATTATTTGSPATPATAATVPTASPAGIPVTTPPASSTGQTANGTSPSSTQSQGSGTASPVVGVNVGSAIAWELPFAQQLGARDVRMNFAIGTPTSQMDSVIGAYARAGIRAELLATFDGSIPTGAQIANLAAWASRYGPGGSFWAQSGLSSSLAVTRIEFGNESSGAWEYPSLASDPDWPDSPIYTRIAEQYGQAYVQAVQAVSAANSQVKVLAVADAPGQATQWLAGMFAGAPDLGSVVQGWVVHPYGTGWKADIDTTLAQTESLGASSSVPVYVTEVGLATDNGNCLSGNYGWNACMTYQQAASTLTGQVQGIEADLGSRLAELDLYSARDIDQTGASNDMEGYFGALQSNGQPKGAYTTAVQNILATTSN